MVGSERINLPLEDKYQRKIHRKNYENCFVNGRGIKFLIFPITPVRVVIAYTHFTRILICV